MLESNAESPSGCFGKAEVMKFWSLCLVLLLAFGSMDADAARRMGGGGSVGRQSSNVTQREAGRGPAAAPQAAPN
ncbi:MAG: Tim44 domain-containing protein, partial [Ramlibacter sp.]|nr:Tim44 domain-containing protein [Ramlibacter sp.]